MTSTSTIRCDDSRSLLVKHLAASRANVLLVIVTRPDVDRTTTYGIFRSMSRAEEWADDEGDDDAVTIFAPFVLDEPDFGNVPRKRMA